MEDMTARKYPAASAIVAQSIESCITWKHVRSIARNMLHFLAVLHMQADMANLSECEINDRVTAITQFADTSED